MQIIEFIEKMELTKNNFYNIDRQTIYNINNKELSIEEWLTNDNYDFILLDNVEPTEIKNMKLYVQINDFNENKRLGILIKSIKDNKIISGTVCDEWLFNEIE